MTIVNATLDLGPASLEPALLGATNQYEQTQSYTNLVLVQPALNLHVDAGLAYEVKTFQRAIKKKGAFFTDEVMGGYIGLFTGIGGLGAMFAGFEGMHQASSQPSLTEVPAEAGLVAQTAADAGSKGRLLAADMHVVNGELKTLKVNFDTTVSKAIAALKAEAATASADIDSLKTAIEKNISDIVEGSWKVGGAVTELGIGTLTTIAGGEGSAGKAIKGATDFSTKAIHGAVDGATETAQARADLNANNKKLAAKYQELAGFDAEAAIAKVAQVQADLFITAMSRIESSVTKVAKSCEAVATDYGQLASHATSGSLTVAELGAAIRAAKVRWASLGHMQKVLKASLIGTSV